MANQEHVALLKKSVEEWNQWRSENPGVIPNLKKANLKKANLEKANLKKANLEGAKLNGANLSSALFTKAELDKADFTGATITQDQLLQANYLGAIFGNRDFPVIYEAYQKSHNVFSKDIRRIGLVLLAYATFCALSLGKAKEILLIDNEVTIPFADVPIGFQTFMVVGHLGLIVITIYFHVFIHEWHRYEELPHKLRLPYSFNLYNQFAQFLSNSVFYFLTPAVLFVFSIKSRMLPGIGDALQVFSWIVAATMIYLYGKNKYDWRQTYWGKALYIFFGILIFGTGYLAEVSRDIPLQLGKGASLVDRDFSGWNLKGLVAKKANLQNATLESADLFRANLQGANLYGANLIETNLQETNLRGTNLQGANLYGADLVAANLEEADLYGAGLQAANLRGVKNMTCKQLNSIEVLDDKTIFPEYLEVEVMSETEKTCKEMKK